MDGRNGVAKSCYRHNKLLLVLFLGAVIGLLTGCPTIPLDDPNWYGNGGAGQNGTTDPKTNKPSGDSGGRLPPAPFDLGAVVARNADHYREFWGMTNEGHFIVQDFYEKRASSPEGGIVSVDVSAAKLTDPYILLNQADVQTWLLAKDTVQQQYKALAVMPIQGPYVQWYANGNKAIEGPYQQGLQQGVWTLWYENGGKMLQEEVKDGVRQGESKGWYANGKPVGQGRYLDGQRHGLWTVWYENGSKLQEGNYEQGVQTGAWKFYYDNGVAKEAGMFENGQQVGVWSWWNRNGDLVREGEYSQNAPVSGSGSGRIKPRYAAP